MGVLVKICGVNSLAAADAVARSGADFAGLNFHPASPRFVDPELARAIADRLRGRAKLVALFADTDDEAIGKALDLIRPDFLQLHGGETVERVSQLRSRFSLPVVKAIALADAADVREAGRFEQVADMMLFDAKAPRGADRPGGHGAAFDWQLLAGRQFSRPWLLAGGLTPENVGRALAITGAPGVDTSSGVETAPGTKSPELIASFVACARGGQFARTDASS